MSYKTNNNLNYWVNTEALTFCAYFGVNGTKSFSIIKLQLLKLKKVIIPVMMAGIFAVALPIFGYFPYFGLWDESEIFEDMDDSEIISKSKSLEESKLFLEKHPQTEIKIEHERGQVRYVVEKIIDTKFGDAERRLDLQIQFDMLKNPSPYMIGCMGRNSVASGENILEKISSDWCFTGDAITIPD